MLDNSLRAIRIQINKLDNIDGTLWEKDKHMFNRVITDVRRSDLKRAEVIANELVQLRRMKKMVTAAKLALNQIALRLGTVRELGDVTVTLSSAVAAVNGVKDGIVNVVPEAEKSFEEIKGTLSNTLVGIGQAKGLTLDFGAANVEAEKILQEASTFAETKLREEFPELPADLTETTSEPVEA